MDARIRSRLLQVFTRQTAEQEEEWLAQVFLPPARWPYWQREDESLLVVGESGSGRTALARMFLGGTPSQDAPSPFKVLWEPAPPARTAYTTAWEVLGSQLLREGVKALLSYLARHGHWTTARPQWFDTALYQLVHGVLPEPVQMHLWPLVRQGEGGASTLQDILLGSQEVPVEHVTFAEGAAYLVTLVQVLGFSAVWVVMDIPSEETEFGLGLLEAWANTLRFMDVPGLVFKCLVPRHIFERLSHTVGVLRRRLPPEALRWTGEDMQVLVEKRLAWATEGQWTRLQDVVADDAFLKWLHDYGRGHPRTWLGLMAPFVQARLNREKPLGPEDWRGLARAFPPPLYVDEAQHRVYAGAREISLTGEETWKLLRYLYRRGGQICSREEVYFQGLQGMARVPSPGDPDYEAPALWRARLDTLLYRLRKDIEPDPRKPAYLETVRGQGIRLRHTATALGLRRQPLDLGFLRRE